MDALVPIPNQSRRGSIAFAAAILALTVATIAGALAFQAAGYPPCELCLEERLPYYVGIALAAVTFLLLWRGAMRSAQAGFALLTLVFLFSLGFGAYHAGVEWHLWRGPAGCTGALTRATSNADFLHQLQTTHVIRCDAAALRVLGLSLAGWNAVISLVLAALALAGLGRAVGPWLSGR